jgi:hypothetical protein
MDSRFDVRAEISNGSLMERAAAVEKAIQVRVVFSTTRSAITTLINPPP